MITDFTSVFSNVYQGERIKYFSTDVKREKTNETNKENVLGSTFSDFASDQFSGQCKSSIKFLKTIHYKSIAS